ncbi:holin [Lactococcus lactis]|uniref:holin n=1 Tax=Lactococcus lactis TaxID=1358 RepID=UPI002416FCD4|nr:holin [Lactococcus lactis]MDG4985763.1 holin [Lactococcus lactis]
MKNFLRDLAERAIKTFAQSMVALLTAGATGILEVDWINTLSVALLATVISVFTSLASLSVGEETASLINNKKEDQLDIYKDMDHEFTEGGE